MQAARVLKLYVLGIALFLIIPGCAASVGNMKSWVGVHYSRLVASWGPPQLVFDDGYSGRVLVYTQSRTPRNPRRVTNATIDSLVAYDASPVYTKSRPRPPAPVGTITTPDSATAYDDQIWGQGPSGTYYSTEKAETSRTLRTFWVDKRGYIYRWFWRGR